MVSNSNLLAFVDAKLAYEIDVVAASRAQTDGTAVIVDTRKQLSWDHGHVADTLDARLATLRRDRTLVVYGWGPGCNGATHTARHLLAENVREQLGGYEYWARNGFAVERVGAVTRQAPDPLVTAE